MNVVVSKEDAVKRGIVCSVELESMIQQVGSEVTNVSVFSQGDRERNFSKIQSRIKAVENSMRNLAGIYQNPLPLTDANLDDFKRSLSLTKIQINEILDNIESEFYDASANCTIISLK